MKFCFLVFVLDNFLYADFLALIGTQKFTALSLTRTLFVQMYERNKVGVRDYNQLSVAIGNKTYSLEALKISINIIISSFVKSFVTL